MNTTAKGDSFEEISYRVIQVAIDEGKLGVIPAQCRIYAKKGYYSDKRKSDIVFDIAIEVWYPNAERYTLLFLVECKNYNSTIPVNDVEEFWGKVQQVSGMNVKGIFIANNRLQKGALEFAESVGFMLIQVDIDESYNIKLYSYSRSEQIENNNFDALFYKQLRELFVKNAQHSNIKRLSSRDIEIIAACRVQEFDKNIIPWTGLNLLEYKIYLEKEHQLTINFNEDLEKYSTSNKILGFFDNKEQTIYVDRKIINTNNFPFIFAHEIGHFFLHRNLTMNQDVYDSFKDSEYSFRLDRHELINDKNWIEWQANKFASAFLMPAPTIVSKLEKFQKTRGVRNVGKIYVDSQYTNLRMVTDTINHLAIAFDVSKKSLEYRLLDLGILQYANEVKHISSYLDEWIK